VGTKPKKLERVNVDQQSEEIRSFISKLPVTDEGCLLVLNGKPLYKVVLNTAFSLDKRKLKEAILSRRDESRRLNQEWADADRELWRKLDEMENQGEQGCPATDSPGAAKSGLRTSTQLSATKSKRRARS
jgi:hypothetical protein